MEQQVIVGLPLCACAHWGMTEVEVLSAFEGEAQRRHGHDNSGDEQLSIQIPALAIGGTRLDALFGFDAEGCLSVVVLQPSDGDRQDRRRTFDQLEHELADQHGSPQTGDPGPEPQGGDAVLRTWRLPSTVIDLAYVGSSGEVSLSYRPPAS